MSATAGTVEMNVRSGLKLLSLGMSIYTNNIGQRITGGTDAGGAQAVSQLRILEHVMEKISQDNEGTSEGILKRPCEVFDVIGGVGTGG
jgi:hypothetical protein